MGERIKIQSSGRERQGLYFVCAIVLLAACGGGGDEEGADASCPPGDPSCPDANLPPTAAFAVSTSSGPPPLSVDFDASASTDGDGEIAGYAWYFGDGGTGSGASASHVFESEGAYTVTLTVTDDGGATGDATRLIVVGDQPNVLAHYSFDNAQDSMDPRGGGVMRYDADTGAFVGGSGAGSGERSLVQTQESGAWDGGVFLRHRFNGVTGQNDEGIGILAGEMQLYGQYSVGMIIRRGATWDAASNPTGATTPKIGLLHPWRDGARQHGESPTIYEEPACSRTYRVPSIGSAPSDVGWGPEAGKTGSLRVGEHCDHAIRLEDYDGQWLYYEVTHIMGDGIYFSVYDRSGAVALASNPSEQNWTYRYENVGSANAASTSLGEWRHVAYVDYSGSGADEPDSYYDVADVYFSDQWMGPPLGFVQ